MRFWGRMAAASVWVNLPVAWAVANGLLNTVTGAIYAGATGVVMLAIFSGMRTSVAHVDGDAVVAGGTGGMRGARLRVLDVARTVDRAAAH